MPHLGNFSSDPCSMCYSSHTTRRSIHLQHLIKCIFCNLSFWIPMPWMPGAVVPLPITFCTPMFGPVLVWNHSGPALASAGPDLKHFGGAPLSGVGKHFRERSIMIQIVTFVKSEDRRGNANLEVSVSPLQQRLSLSVPHGYLRNTQINP